MNRIRDGQDGGSLFGVSALIVVIVISWFGVVVVVEVVAVSVVANVKVEVEESCAEIAVPVPIRERRQSPRTDCGDHDDQYRDGPCPSHESNHRFDEGFSFRFPRRFYRSRPFVYLRGEFFQAGEHERDTVF